MGLTFGIEVIIAVLAGLYLFSYGVVRLMARVWCTFRAPRGHLSRGRAASLAGVAYFAGLVTASVLPSMGIFLPIYGYFLPGVAIALVGLPVLVADAPAPARA